MAATDRAQPPVDCHAPPLPSQGPSSESASSGYIDPSWHAKQNSSQRTQRLLAWVRPVNAQVVGGMTFGSRASPSEPAPEAGAYRTVLGIVSTGASVTETRQACIGKPLDSFTDEIARVCGGADSARLGRRLSRGSLGRRWARRDSSLEKRRSSSHPADAAGRGE